MPETADELLRMRFSRAAGAARDNLGAAVDLVLVHNETVVRGRQPRATLNRAIVMMTIGAWGRFVIDTHRAFKPSGIDKKDRQWYPGSDRSGDREWYAHRAAQLLSEMATDGQFHERIHVCAATDWAGVELKRMEDLTGEAPGQWSQLTFSQHLNQWINLRNALAHGSVRHLVSRAKRAGKAGGWTDPVIGDPYASASGERYRLWQSDAVGNATQEAMKLDGATVQAGSARNCLALIVQTVDWLMVDVAQARGRNWEPEEFRLPASWFEPGLPEEFRGATRDGYAHWSLWGGRKLYRRES